MSVVSTTPESDLALCIPDLRTKKRDAALTQLVAAAAVAGVVADPSAFLETLNRRERVCGFDLGRGVAVPHARSVTVLQPRVVVGRCPRGVEWTRHGPAVQLIVLVAAPADCGLAAWHDLLTRAAGLGRLQRERLRLLGAEPDELPARLREALE